MLVRDVMIKSVFTLNLSDNFRRIVKLLSRKKISGAPVVNKRGKVVGIISEKDLFHKLFPSQKMFYKDPEYFMNFDRLEKDAKGISKVTAKKIMSRKVFFVEPEDHVLKACSLFVMHNVRRLPVLTKGKLVGIVTTGNIYRNFLLHVVGK